MTLPSILVMVATLLFLILERMFPGRRLPESKGWYWRALLINLTQLGITLVTARLWIHLFGGVSIFKLASLQSPLLEGLIGWFVGTFFFYWWHVLRHRNGFWLIFHQIHHSPSRIEIATSFYKHPVEILSDAILSALILYPLMGASMMGAFWYNFLAGVGEYSTTPISRHRVGCDTSFRRPSCIQFITSMMCIDTISVIFRYGIGCSVLTRTRPSLFQDVVFPTGRKSGSARCCGLGLCIGRRLDDQAYRHCVCSDWAMCGWLGMLRGRVDGSLRCSCSSGS